MCVRGASVTTRRPADRKPLQRMKGSAVSLSACRCNRRSRCSEHRPPCADCGATEVRHVGRGRCSSCYYKHKRELKALGVFEKHPSWIDRDSRKGKGRTAAQVVEILTKDSVISVDGCWIYQRQPGADGYIFFDGAGAHHAHRAMYIAFNGFIESGLYFDHTCHNRDQQCTGGRDCMHRRCVNPAHLQAVEPRDNLLRSRNAPSTLNSLKTSCVRGHPYSAENTGLSTVRGKVVRRYCKLCRKAYAARRYRAKKEASNGE